MTEQERRNKISKAMKISSKKGDEHPFWKGDKVNYSSLHEWIRKYKPKPNLCEICNQERKLEIANISGEYKRDIKDFKWLCRSCHRKLDFDWDKYDGGFKVRPLSFWAGKTMPDDVKVKMRDSQKLRRMREKNGVD